MSVSLSYRSLSRLSKSSLYFSVLGFSVLWDYCPIVCYLKFAPVELSVCLFGCLLAFDVINVALIK